MMDDGFDNARKECFGVSVIGILGLLAMMWAFYGMFCINACGMKAAQCRLVSVISKIEVCSGITDQHGWNEYGPYTAVGTFCFDAVLPSGNNHNKTKHAVLCTTENIGCGGSSQAAIEDAYSRYPKGTVRNCYYAVDSNYDGSYYFSWFSPGAGAMPTWFEVNIITTIACAAILFLLLIINIMISCGCFKCTRYDRYNTYDKMNH